jgi:hypothetical protein
MSRILYAFIAFFAFTSLAFAAPQTAQQFLQSIYAQYHGDTKASPGVRLDSAADYRRYFDASLVKLIVADEDAAKKRGDVPELDGDPFINAQDWDITGVAIHMDSGDASKAAATVRFQNFKEAKIVHVSLVNTPAGWRIDDIDYGGGQTFRGLYKPGHN